MKKRETGCERECDGEKENSGEKRKLAEWQDSKLLIPCVTLAKEMESVKSQRGAKSAARYGTTHQNPLELMKTCD